MTLYRKLYRVGDFLAGPHISMFSVSPRASSDGKLSVRLQVDTTLE